MPSTNHRELPFLVREWRGVNRAIDAARIPPDYAVQTTNWVPSIARRLSKRTGTTVYGTIASASTIHAGIRLLVGGVYYCYVIARVSGVDGVYLSTNDGAFALISNGAFSTAAGPYVLLANRGIVYASNASDPIKRIPVGGAATNLTSFTAVTDASAAPTLTADTGSSILTGTYAYCWGLYDSTAKQWRARSQARFITVNVSGDRLLSFPAPSGFSGGSAPTANDRYHLFVSPVNLPIEFAHSQVPEGIDAGAGGGGVAAPVILRNITADGPPTPLSGVTRNGGIGIVHRDALWHANGRDLFSTAIIPPGREQALFDHGDFWPAQAVWRAPDTITGIGVAASAAIDSPYSPLVIGTADRVWLWYGDLYDDPTAHREELPIDGGIVASKSVVSTSMGLMFLSTRTIYLIPAGGGAPIDVGWPIEPDIRAIPRAQRTNACATFNDGFYKIAFPSAGGSTNTVEFWLDLRRGIDTIPSWYGPHTTCTPVAYWTSRVDTGEDDRLWAGTVTGKILLCDQSSSYRDDATPIVSIFRTAQMDLGDPFRDKILARVRVTGRAPAVATIEAVARADEGMTAPLDALTLNGDATILWDVDWDVAWGDILFAEGETISFDQRLRGRLFDITLTHNAEARIDLRDFEALFLPVERRVRQYDPS